ncbi:hypothetical protein R3P38DRAFT_3113708 [Favolaschia claudopus]|uniref:Uncharacterized protein n=1 Tax=Favolaschia claudopus TaxID=2862362 RepID=A0AAV9ZGN1_9AGAR
MSQSKASENTRLLSNSPPPPVNQATRPSSSTDTGITGTLWTVCQLVHGAGETVRGTLLGAIDDVANKGEQKHHNVAREGRAALDQAYQKLWGSTSSSSATPQSPPVASAGYTTGYDAAPPTYQASPSGYGSDGMRPDYKAPDGA